MGFEMYHKSMGVDYEHIGDYLVNHLRLVERRYTNWGCIRISEFRTM